ncbi:hypothetical protein SRIMM317S_04580 [Streptomyces rimosus subsp. rimosus]
MEHPVVAEGFAEQPGGAVRAAGVGADDLLWRAFLAEQPGQRVGQPAFAVVRDEHGGDDVPGELWGAVVVLGGGLRGLGGRLTVAGTSR